jgi:hypothetical protein
MFEQDDHADPSLYLAVKDLDRATSDAGAGVARSPRQSLTGGGNVYETVQVGSTRALLVRSRGARSRPVVVAPVGGSFHKGYTTA